MDRHVLERCYAVETNCLLLLDEVEELNLTKLTLRADGNDALLVKRCLKYQICNNWQLLLAIYYISNLLSFR